jgi:hypothetical protein
MFNEPSEFPKFWAQLTNQLKPGGLFVGDFFGPKFEGFKEKDKVHMTWLDEEQVRSLFKGFNILVFRVTDKPAVNPMGIKTHEHVFEVVARKNTGTP